MGHLGSSWVILGHLGMPAWIDGFGLDLVFYKTVCGQIRQLGFSPIPDRSGRPQDAEAESAAQEMFWSVDVLVIEETKESSR